MDKVSHASDDKEGIFLLAETNRTKVHFDANTYKEWRLVFIEVVDF